VLNLERIGQLEQTLSFGNNLYTDDNNGKTIKNPESNTSISAFSTLIKE
jgi:hypothetical protein